LPEGGIPALVDLPPLSDPQAELEIVILGEIVAPSGVVPHIYGFVATRLGRMLVEHGLHPLASQGFGGLGLGGSFGRDYDSAYAWGELARALTGKPELAHNRTPALMMHSCWVLHWKRPYAEASELAREALDVGIAAGQFEWAGWSAMNQPTLWLAGGLELERAVARTREIIATSRNVLQFDDSAWIAHGPLRGMLQLMGRQEELAALGEAGMTFDALEEKLAHYPMMRGPFNVGGLWAAHLLGDRDAAATFIERMAPIYLFGGGLCHVPDFVMLQALHTLDGHEGALLPDELKLVQEAIEQLELWAKHCPDNHGCKPLLVRA
jgi:hypothetical protein